MREFTLLLTAADSWGIVVVLSVSKRMIVIELSATLTAPHCTHTHTPTESYSVIVWYISMDSTERNSAASTSSNHKILVSVGRRRLHDTQCAFAHRKHRQCDALMKERMERQFRQTNGCASADGHEPSQSMAAKGYMIKLYIQNRTAAICLSPRSLCVWQILVFLRAPLSCHVSRSSLSLTPFALPAFVRFLPHNFHFVCSTESFLFILLVVDAFSRLSFRFACVFFAASSSSSLSCSLFVASVGHEPDVFVCSNPNSVCRSAPLSAPVCECAFILFKKIVDPHLCPLSLRPLVSIGTAGTVAVDKKHQRLLQPIQRP